jgi:hypothetical protein
MTMSLRDFIELWTSQGYPPDQVSLAELDAAEARLQTRLPTDYRSAVLEFGLPRPTIALLDTIVDHELGLADISDFHAPNEIVAETEGWCAAGMPQDLVAFGSDCCGNKFCFAVSDVRQPEQAVIFWDHDFNSVETVAPSFDRWIETYCTLPR